MRIFANTEGLPALIEAANTLLSALPPLQPSIRTPHFTIGAVLSLGQTGIDIANYVADHCEADYIQLSTWFNIADPAKVPKAFNVIVAPLSQFNDGTGGAFHKACAATDLYCDLNLIPEPNYAFTSALVVAEAVEVFSAKQNLGWNCGASNGEGLSRVLAADRYEGALDGFPTAGAWLGSERADWINSTNYTDREAVSTGCAVLFLNWMHSLKGYDWSRICQAGGTTLAEMYKKVTGSPADPFVLFNHDIEQRFPVGQDSSDAPDNPFKQ